MDIRKMEVSSVFYVDPKMDNYLTGEADSTLQLALSRLWLSCTLKLRDDGIAHGNLKSSNILLNDNMDPCISEYGLMVVENHAQTNSLKDNDPNGGRAYTTFKVDIYGFGVILLELLTGKLVQNTGSDLAKWVHSVVKEEWTVEVFDKSLTSEGASEERLVSLLQVALKCINDSPEARPSIQQVAEMIYSIKEEEDRSLSY